MKSQIGAVSADKYHLLHNKAKDIVDWNKYDYIKLYFV